MAMSDCVECWETPCACGHDYEHWSVKRLQDQIAMLQRVLTRKQALNPNRNVADMRDTTKPGNR